MLQRTFYQIKRSWLSRRKQRNRGFTLLELLISMFIGTLIVVTMLSLVLEISESDRKDAARTEVQRDMQLAMNYIAQDLREAVFVYDGRCLGSTPLGNATTDYATFCPGLLNHLPSGWNGNMSEINKSGGAFTPLLAFWKPEELPQAVLDACATAAKNTGGTSPTDAIIDLVNNKGIPCISGRSYTLIVYGLDTRNPSNLWKGRARLSRYRLSQFSESFDPASPTTNTGWVNPKETVTSGFLQWPYIVDVNTGSPANAQGSNRPTGSPEALVDFVDNGLPTSRTPKAEPPACANPASGLQTVPTFPFSDVNNQFPASAAIPGLFACVRGNLYTSTALPATEQTVNQEVQVTLIGSVDGRGGFPIKNTGNYSTSGRVFPLQTRVLTRGILEKGSD